MLSDVVFTSVCVDSVGVCFTEVVMIIVFAGVGDNVVDPLGAGSLVSAVNAWVVERVTGKSVVRGCVVAPFVVGADVKDTLPDFEVG